MAGASAGSFVFRAGATSMPKSKRRRYQPPPRRRPKPSPRWFGALILGMMLGGGIIVVLNYMNLMPYTGVSGFLHLKGGHTENWPLFGGGGLAAAGLLLATRWR